MKKFLPLPLALAVLFSGLARADEKSGLRPDASRAADKDAPRERPDASRAADKLRFHDVGPLWRGWPKQR